MSLKTVFREVLRWECYRIKFNTVMLLSGLLLLLTIDLIKPTEIQGIKKGKELSNYYNVAIFLYGLLANFVFTVIYIFIILLKSKLKINELNAKIDYITRRFILKSGLFANLLTGFLELIYRFKID
jgi:hypothetical protein